MPTGATPLKKNMFSEWDKCTDVLLNVTLSAVSLVDHAVADSCHTWQALLKSSLHFTNTDGSLLDVISDSDDFTAIPPYQRSEKWNIGATDAVLLLFVYFTVFAVASQAIQGLA